MVVLFCDVAFQAAQLRELALLEPTCKWAKLTLAHTLARLNAALPRSRDVAAATAAGSGSSGDNSLPLEDEAGRLGDEEAAHLADLADLDPLRKGYYASLLAAH